MYRIAIVVLLLSLLNVGAFADHCPEEAVADGTPETHLAGIAFERGDFPEVLKQFGPPDDGRKVGDGEYRPGTGEVLYSWNVGSSRLQVFTAYYHAGSRKIESTLAVRVDGMAPVAELATKRGLNLGDSFERVKKLYGPLYLDGPVNGPRLRGKTKTFCFQDDTELGVGVDENGRVVSIWLSPSAE